MTPQELASKLDGLEYPAREIGKQYAQQAKSEGLVIVYGASDDLMEFEGAFHDEAGVNDGGTVMVTTKGIVEPWESIDHDDIDACRKFFKNEGSGKPIEAVWGKGGVSWQYVTEIPHAKFNIMEDGEIYCIGIAFKIADVGSTLEQ